MFENVRSFLFFINDFIESLNIRIEYIAVIPMDIIIIIVRSDRSLELIICSMIESFE